MQYTSFPISSFLCPSARIRSTLNKFSRYPIFMEKGHHRSLKMHSSCILRAIKILTRALCTLQPLNKIKFTILLLLYPTWHSVTGNFSKTIQVAGTRMSPFWILLQLRITEVVAVTTGAIRRAKLQSDRHHQTNQQPAFYRPDAFPVAEPTVSKHWSEEVPHFMDLLTPSSPGGLRTLSLTTKDALVAVW